MRRLGRSRRTSWPKWDGAVGGDEEVEHVELLGTGVGRESGVGTGVGLDDPVGLDGGPGVACDLGRSGPVLAATASSPVSAPSGERAAGVVDVDDAVAGDAVGGELSRSERFSPEGLDRVAPEL